MDVKIENSDIALNMKGEPIYINFVEEIAQRVKIACSFEKGEFCYNKNLGRHPSDIDFYEDDAKDKLEMLFKEASVDIGYTDLEVLSIENCDMGHIAKVKVKCGENYAVTEVVVYE